MISKSTVLQLNQTASKDSLGMQKEITTARKEKVTQEELGNKNVKSKKEMQNKIQ